MEKRYNCELGKNFVCAIDEEKSCHKALRKLFEIPHRSPKEIFACYHFVKLRKAFDER